MEDVVVQAQTAAYRYGLKPGEFWSLTPHETYIWIGAQVERDEDAYRLAAWTAWHVAAFSRYKRLNQKSDLKAFDRKKKKTAGQSMDQMKKQARANTIMLGGKVK